mgnify:FL=1
MAVYVNEKQRTFTLQTKNTTYQMKVDAYGMLLHTYYGEKTDNSDLSYRIPPDDRGFSGYAYEASCADDRLSSDLAPQEYSCFGTGDYRISALRVRNENGSQAVTLCYAGYELSRGKYSIPGLPAVYADETEAETLGILLRDPESGLEVLLQYGVLEELDIITRAVKVVNRTMGKVVLLKAASMCLDWLSGDYEWLTFYGKHAMERTLQRTPIAHGISAIGSVRGASSHHYNPFAVVCEKDTNETKGLCYGVSFVYSGEFLMETEKDQIDQTRLICGIHPDDFAWTLEPGESFDTPEVILSCSSEGFGKLSHNFHQVIREHICRGEWKNKRRPVLINNWEGTYFDFTGDKLVSIAKDAAELGVELFVMDDGWFGDKYRRVQDNSSLGDWVVDRKKLPNGLENLIQTADRNGIKFGIWIEPEAVNSKSELFEKHPDWALQVKGRPLQYGRGGTQMLLDVCNPKVQDFMFGIVDNLLGKHPQIAYIKWDANVELKNYGSTYLPQDKQSHIYIEYHRGLNKVLERIRAKYPDVLIQACGGGGGRASYGVLPYFDEFWVSDNTDALQRIYMQWGTSYFYPSNAMAQHISASPNHQTGRIIPIKFRCDVAMSGRLGMELQPSKMTKEEYQQTAQAIKDYKSVRDVIQLGNLYRLVSPYDDKGIASLMYTDDTEDKAVFFAYKMEHFNNQVIPRVCLRGLDPSKNYRVRELNVKTGGQPCFLNGKTFSGALLMNTGIEMPLGSDYASCVLELTAE